MAKIVGQSVGPAGEIVQMLAEALQDAMENAPPPPGGTDTMRFTVLAIELQHGGFTGQTVTRVTLDAQPGEMPPVQP